MKATIIFILSNGNYGTMSPFCFVLWLVIIIAITTIIIAGLTFLYKYLKARVVISTSKINLESEILKNLRELVKADEYRRNHQDNSPRKFIYEKTKSTYELKSEEVTTKTPGS
jgi:hypothetical protein